MYGNSWHAYILSDITYVWLFETLWTVALQGPLSMGFSKQEYWSELPFGTGSQKLMSYWLS